MDDFDGDFGEPADSNNNNSDNRGQGPRDYLLDQRSTERAMQEITSQGYRDAYQSQFEDEKLMQVGFDIAFKKLAPVSFLVGQIRSLAAHSRILNRDSAFLARLNDKLERIERNSYERLLEWRSDDPVTGLSDQQLETVVQEHQNHLTAFKSLLSQLASAKKPSGTLSEAMSSLNAIGTDADEQDEPVAQLDTLNSLLDSWNL